MGDQRRIDVAEGQEIHETGHPSIGETGIIMIKMYEKYGMLCARSVK